MKGRATGLYGLIAKPAPVGAPPATMSMSDALSVAIANAEASDPINYPYIHALRAAALRLDHTVTDALARTLETLLAASAGYDSCSAGQQDEFDAAVEAAQTALNTYRGITT